MCTECAIMKIVLIIMVYRGNKKEATQRLWELLTKVV